LLGCDNINRWDSKVYKKSFHLYKRIYSALINFPKSEKYALCKDVKTNYNQLMKYILLADKVKSKRKKYQEEADGYLQILKFLFDLIDFKEYLSKNFIKDIHKELSEIGFLLSGWIKKS
jgi:hypothetical protein